MACKTPWVVLIVWNLLKLYWIGGMTLLTQVFSKHRSHGDLSDQHGCVAIVTGGATGIGYEIVKGLLKKGMHVIIGTNRDSHGQIAVDKLKIIMPNSNVEYWHLDLSSLESIRNFVARFKNEKLPLHMLINNAGVMIPPYTTTMEGYESQIGINYLGHFLLTNLLIDVLKQCGLPERYARIVNISSSTHYVGTPELETFTCRECYSAHGGYAWSKLAAVLFTYEIQKRLSLEGVYVTANTLHPGVINTPLYRHVHPLLKPFVNLFAWLLFKTPEQGADTPLYVALSHEIEGIGGHYYDNCQDTQSSRISYDKTLQINLWTKSCKLVGL